MRDGTAFVSVPQSYATFLNACSRGLSSSAMYLEVHPSTPKTTAALIDEGPAVITHTRAFSLRPLMLHARSDQSEPDVDHYQVLSLPHDCSEEDIKRRHEELKESLKSLPSVDRRITKKIKEAYKVLSNPTSRAIYDEKLKRTEAEDVLPDDGEDVSDEEYSGDDDVELFALPDSDDEIEVTIQEPPNKKRSGLTGFLGNLFGFNNEPGLKERTRPRSNDISTTANTELRHLIFGGTVKVSVEKFGDCPACNSSKRVQREYINTCAKCQGRGMISKSQRTPFGYISTSRSCMSCNGRGVSRVQDCSNCNNTGRVQLQSEVEFEVPAGARAGSVFKVKGRGHSGGYFSRPGDLFVKVETDENGHEFIDGDKVYTTANVDYVLAILGGTNYGFCGPAGCDASLLYLIGVECMNCAEGRCTFSASGRTLFRRDSRRFCFASCQVLTPERCQAEFSAKGALCITGPCSSKKTLILLHALADVLSSYGMRERAVFLDFDLSFDFAAFKKLIRSKITEHGLTGPALEAETEAALKRLVYIPVYELRDVPALFVALDFYFQCQDVKVVVLDSLLTKPGNVEDELVENFVRLLQSLHKKHGLMLLYTKREGSGFTVPFHVTTFNRDGPLSEAAGSYREGKERLANGDLVADTLSFGLPVDWVPFDEDATQQTADRAPSPLAAVRHKRMIMTAESFELLPVQTVDRACDGKASDEMVHKRPDVTVCLLPCRQASSDPQGYLGCVYKTNAPHLYHDSNLQWKCARQQWKHFNRVHRILAMSSAIEQSEGENCPDSAEICSDFDDIRTQDLEASEKLMTEPAVSEMGGSAITAERPHPRSRSKLSNNPSIDIETLQNLKFGLFKISGDNSLRSQVFELDR
ncbi:molecular chaperone DnaJ [Babesia caballi]|uniref:Molecular chaperone DnaJ n=1 Tax=Babesia caballi TaxID=5871 RepID=A0AAV4LW80_BABCB|nr:molecular chaperone DnaJ [Babesia caballi]